MKSEKGITLIEGLITLAIASVIGILLVVILVNTGGLFYQQSGKVEQGLNINDALAEIGQSIKQASAVAPSYPQAPPATYTSGPQQMVLKIPSISSSGEIISNTFDYFVFFSDTGKLRFKIFPDAGSTRKAQDQIFSTNVDSLKFQYFDLSNSEVVPTSAVKVKITLTLKQKAGAGIEQNIATTEANLRND